MGARVWSDTSLDRRRDAEAWAPTMRDEARSAATEFEEEVQRLESGLTLLRSNDILLRSFRLMNEAMSIASRGRYEGWRPFQVGFLLANFASILGRPDDTSLVDILWFATGGGKTETYLGLLIAAAFHDRLTGKVTGITAWSRFPSGCFRYSRPRDSRMRSPRQRSSGGGRISREIPSRWDSSWVKEIRPTESGMSLGPVNRIRSTIPCPRDSKF